MKVKAMQVDCKKHKTFKGQVIFIGKCDLFGILILLWFIYLFYLVKVR